MIPQSLIFDRGGKFLNQCSGNRHCLFSLYVSSLSLIELALSDTNTPLHWSSSLRCGHLLRCLQYNFGFVWPLCSDQSFTTQFQDMEGILSSSSLRIGCDQLIDDL